MTHASHALLLFTVLGVPACLLDPDVIGETLTAGPIESGTATDAGPDDPGTASNSTAPPEAGAPPADCHAITDQAICLESDCSEWKEVPTVSVVNQVCTCGAPVPACLWFPGVPGLVDEPGLFYDLSTHQVVAFPQAWLDPPLGWAPCTGSPSEPAACACAAPGEDPCG